MTAAEAEEIRQMAENLMKAYTAFTSTGGQYETDLAALESRTVGQVQELADKIAKWTFLDTYISMGEEGLVIGSHSSSLKMIMSENQLAFVDGGQTVAYFSNQSFFIRNGILTDSVQIGVHKFVNMGGGHTSVLYIKQ